MIRINISDSLIKKDSGFSSAVELSVPSGNGTSVFDFHTGVCKRALTRALTLLGLGLAEVDVSLVDKATITKLAGEYRSDPRPTDVLSFNLTADNPDPQSDNEGDESVTKGEIIVCPEVISANAEKFKTVFQEELLRVIVHGLIHLKGMDHEPHKFPLKKIGNVGKYGGKANGRNVSEESGVAPKAGGQGRAVGGEKYRNAEKMFELQESLVKQLAFDVFAPKVIVGLGNPGEKYARSRHNAGFMFVDLLLDSLKAALTSAGETTGNKNTKEIWGNFRTISKYGALIADELGSVGVVFVWPQMSMNRSGQVVSDVCKAYKVDPRTSLLVVHDELDLPTGQYKYSYGHGRLHKGVEDIERSLKTTRFWRVRLGVDSRQGDRSMAGCDYVLGGFRPEEYKLFESALTAATKEIRDKLE